MERLQAAIEKAREQRSGTTRSARRPVASRSIGKSMPPHIEEAWAALPEMETPTDRRLVQSRVMTKEPGLTAAPFDLLRTRLLQQARQNEWRRIGFVSPHSACGKSTTVANLAFSLARQDDVHTLVLDFDLRRNGLTKLLKQKPQNSLWQVLSGDVTFADHAKRLGDNVAFGLNARNAPNAAELMQSGHTDTVLAELEEVYAPDLILFDLPPLMAADDNFGFLNKLDAALILISAEKTTMTQIDVAERQVAELTNVMGLVLNQCHFSSGAHGQDYGYY